jgi:glucosamine--fructose-6-phosphate aminotransferase (isomerizing)
MCGIVGYIGNRAAMPVLLEGLKRLEYRGYDSAGTAIMEEKIEIFKSVGKVSNLEAKIGNQKSTGSVGIAHTRWATHGKPSDKNSHPHTDCSGKICLVHNGIIENYKELKEILQKKKHIFVSETDTEVIAHLVEELMKEMPYEQAVREALTIIRGTYGLVIMHADFPDKLIIARKGSPLILGVGNEEYIVASDASAIVNHTRQVIYLEDGELAEVTKDGYQIMDLRNNIIEKPTTHLDWSVDKVQKGGFEHFMLKEIHEQPEAIENSLRGRLDKFIKSNNSMPVIGGLKQVEERLRGIEKIVIVSCGTSYYSGLVAEYMFEEYAEIPTEVEYASEFRYRKPLLDEKTAVLAISQSGETADTLEALREAKLKGALTLGVVNVVGSTIARETDAGIYNYAGPEIGVASTKAFTSQLAVLVLMTMMLGRQRDMTNVTAMRIAKELKKIPEHIKTILKQDKKIRQLAKKYLEYEDWLYLGRKYNFPIAMEGALKLKEISYAHAEGYASGEMKHGPIALINENFPSIFIAVKDSVYDKVLSGMEEIKAREGKIIAIATEGDNIISKVADDVIYIPKTLEMLTPLLSVVPLQLFAYYVGISRGYDVDKPRNLAKSVTVE